MGDYGLSDLTSARQAVRSAAGWMRSSTYHFIVAEAVSVFAHAIDEKINNLKSYCQCLLCSIPSMCKETGTFISENQ